VQYLRIAEIFEARWSVGKGNLIALRRYSNYVEYYECILYYIILHIIMSDLLCYACSKCITLYNAILCHTILFNSLRFYSSSLGVV
jgi:hypothetical protein